MSSNEENHSENTQETEEYNPDNEEVSNVENNLYLDDISPQSDVTFNANDTQNLEHASSSDDHGGKITTEQLPQFESEPTDEERRAECRREKKRCHEPTDEEDGPVKAKGAAKSTDTSHDSTAQSGTVMSTIKKLIKSGHDGSRNYRQKFTSSTYKDRIAPDYMYPMTHSNRGKAFIINNKTFLPLSGMDEYPRKGTDIDAEDLRKLFNDLGFETKVYHNKTSKKIMKKFDKYAAMDHTNYDCIICAVLTHGKEGLIYSTDGQITIKELTAKFRCKSLHGKPKLFFFQACQGVEYMDGHEETDGAGQDNPLDVVDGPGPSDNNKITLPIEADFMYAYSTVPGYYSWRNSERGSWFVQAIVSVFRQNALTMDVLRMMTLVNAEVAKQKSNTTKEFSNNKKQIPSIISQLRKELYFFPDEVMEDVHGDITDATVHKK
ncbi:caspase 3 [Paramuricea clavata]|uniref:Caspase 3 n=1 Tax=Paramuricea clavata TaxID=317549 RepID=A0A7D9HX38_PARCT|nr:caspase 3 [Paramuricea clavata]